MIAVLYQLKIKYMYSVAVYYFVHMDLQVRSHLHWWQTLGVSSNQTAPPAVEESD